MAKQSSIPRATALVSRLLPMPVKRPVPLPTARRSDPIRLNQAAPVGLTQVSVAAGGLAKALLLLDLQTEKDYWLGP
jgi:hypothetical protein